jgi:hypothetical protein
MDPRVKTPQAALQQQFQLSKELYDDALKLTADIEQANAIRRQLKSLRERAQDGTAEAIDAFSKKLDAVAGSEAPRRGRGGAQAPSLSTLRGTLLMLMGTLNEADVAPTSQLVAAVTDTQKKVPAALESWQQFKQKELADLNQQLRAGHLNEVNPEAK